MVEPIESGMINNKGSAKNCFNFRVMKIEDKDVLHQKLIDNSITDAATLFKRKLFVKIIHRTYRKLGMGGL